MTQSANLDTAPKKNRKPPKPQRQIPTEWKTAAEEGRPLAQSESSKPTLTPNERDTSVTENKPKANSKQSLLDAIKYLWLPVTLFALSMIFVKPMKTM